MIVKTTTRENLLDSMIEADLITYSDGSGGTDRAMLYQVALNVLIEEARAEGMEVGNDVDRLPDTVEVWIDDSPYLIEYTLPSHWAPYLIDGDHSGLEDAELAAINRYLDSEGNPNFVSVTEEGFAHSNDANQIGGNVATYASLLPRP